MEIRQRLKFLNDVGLDYLTLDRLSSTLSGGEAQRIQLATCLGSRLVGACYVLDEPSIGLHSRDTGRLIRILEELRDLGNTIVVVEHDADVMRAADHIVDMGPGAGELGGRIIFEGSYRQDRAGRRGLADVALPARRFASRARRRAPRRRSQASGEVLRRARAQSERHRRRDSAEHDGGGDGRFGIRQIDAGARRDLQIARAAAAAARAGRLGRRDWIGTAEKVTCRRVEKAELLREVVLVDQSPIGRTPRSNPVTYIKAFDLIRDIFASTPDARKRGYNGGHFSFNIPGGRCENCQGDGTVTVEMQFLADVELVCEECKGTRFKSSILDIRYQGPEYSRSAAADGEGRRCRSFPKRSAWSTQLKVLDDVGLGYLRLGQSATTLSGGEAQRVKLAAHLAQATCDGTLYIFDEPTTGLHFDDIAKLLAAFQRLIENGGSILIIEHNLDVIRSADWVIDLGRRAATAAARSWPKARRSRSRPRRILIREDI